MPIEFQDVLGVNLVLLGVVLLGEPTQQDQFTDSIDAEIVKEFIGTPPPIPGGPPNPQEPGLVLDLPRDRIQLISTPSRSQIQRQYPTGLDDLERVAEVASRAIDLTDLSGQSPRAFGFNIQLAYRPTEDKPAERYIAERLFLRQQFGIEGWTLIGGGGNLSFEGHDARWNITIEPRANDPSGRKVYLSLNLHRDTQEVPSRQDIVVSLQDIWNRSREFVTQLDKSGVTMVKVASASTHVLQQEPPADPRISERQQTTYVPLRLIRDRREVDATVQGTDWYLPIEIGYRTDRCGRNSGRRITDSRAPQSPFESELDLKWGERPHAQKAAPSYTAYSSALALIRSLDTTLSANSERNIWPTEPLWTTFTRAAGVVEAISQFPATKLLEKRFQRRLEKRSRRIIDMEEILRRFSELPENWDSYGGRAISLDVIDEASWILRAAINLDLPEPWVAPGGDGSVGIEWDIEGAELYVDVAPKEETTYLLTPKEGNIGETDGALTIKNLFRVLSQFAELAT